MSTFKHIDVSFTVFGLQKVVEDRMVIRYLGLVDRTAVVRIVAVLLCTSLVGWLVESLWQHFVSLQITS
jgi:hypothetical protein